jgi:iron complex outermembrane receptor protein
VTIPTGGFDIGVPPGGFDINITYHTPKTTEAVFGQVTWDLTPTFQIQAGARYTHSTFKLDDNNYFFNLPATGTVLHASVGDGAVTGKVALNWRPSDNESFYVFFAEGHKQNGINTNPAVPFGPEEVTDFEGGWKPTFFDGHLRAQIGGYYSLYRHFQLQFFTPNQTSLIQNVQGTTVIYGLEAEAQAVFGPLSFDGGLSYEHSRLGAALISDPSSTPAGAMVQLGGRPLPLAPEWTFNVGAQYAFQLWNGATLTPDIEYSYVAGQWDTPFHHFGEYLNPRNIVNGQLVFAQDDWKLSFYINNATNLHYIASINAGLPFELRYAGPPRQYGFRLEKKF